MKTYAKTILSAVILITIISFAVNAQTFVSGGIYANTTWTLANSPYIVTDTVVVFPGFTLTIEPGVVVKFDNNQMLEIRQAKLIADGTATDSITFTSNSPSPTPGIYGGVLLNEGTSTQITYCNFYYAQLGFHFSLHSINGFTVKHCKAMYNQDGIWGYSLGSLIDSCDIRYNTGWAEAGIYNITNCNISNNYRGITDGFYINNCIVDSNNEIGIYENSGSILNCFIRYDSIGIFAGNPVTINNCTISHNYFGIMPATHQTITYCIIDSNNYGIENGELYFNSMHSENNTISFCEINNNGIGIYDNPYGPSTITKNIIENDSIGIYLCKPDNVFCNKICNNTSYNLKYLSSNNTNCVANNYWCTTDSAALEALIYDGYDNVAFGLVDFMPMDTLQCYLATGITLNSLENNSFSIYPNPFTDQLTITTKTTQPAEITLYDITSRKILHNKFNGTTTINTQHLAKGIYIYEVRDKEGVIKKGKVVKE